MTPNYLRSATITLFPLTADGRQFDLVIYGVTPRELMVIPNPVTPALAEKYPFHTSSIFTVR